MKLIVLHVTYKEWVEKGWGGGRIAVYSRGKNPEKESICFRHTAGQMDGVRRCLEDRRLSFVSYFFLSPFFSYTKWRENKKKVKNEGTTTIIKKKMLGSIEN